MTNRLKLLVIDDDNAQVRLLTKAVGTAFGGRLDMTAMTDAMEARNWIERCSPDLVITDLEMPGASGLDILRAAKRCNPTTQVLLLTGHSSRHALLEALEFGASDYLIKPLDPAAIAEVLCEAVKRIERWRAALDDAHGEALVGRISSPSYG